MRCRKVERLLSDYIDERISAVLKADLESHLKGCKVCTQHLIAFRKTDELVQLKAEEHPRPEYWNSYWMRLKDKLEHTATTSILKSEARPDKRLFPSFFPGFRLAINAAIVALFVFTLGLLYRSNHEIKSLRTMLISEAQPVMDTAGIDISIPAYITFEGLTEQAVSKELKLFREIRDMFHRTIRWVVSSNGKIDLVVRVSLDGSVLETALSADEGETMQLGKLGKGDTEYSIYITVRSRSLNIIKA